MSWFSSVGKWSKKQIKFVTRWDEITTNGKILAKQVNLFNPFRKTSGSIRQETFGEAISRRGLSEKDIEGIYKTHKAKFNLFLIILCVTVILAMNFLWEGHWLVLGPAIATLGVCLSQMFNSSFRAYQINRRELVDVNVWWNDGAHWWPSHFQPLNTFSSAKQDEGVIPDEPKRRSSRTQKK